MSIPCNVTIKASCDTYLPCTSWFFFICAFSSIAQLMRGLRFISNWEFVGSYPQNQFNRPLMILDLAPAIMVFSISTHLDRLFLARACPMERRPSDLSRAIEWNLLVTFSVWRSKINKPFTSSWMFDIEYRTMIDILHQDTWILRYIIQMNLFIILKGIIFWRTQTNSWALLKLQLQQPTTLIRSK